MSNATDKRRAEREARRARGLPRQNDPADPNDLRDSERGDATHGPATHSMTVMPDGTTHYTRHAHADAARAGNLRNANSPTEGEERAQRDYKIAITKP